VGKVITSSLLLVAQRMSERLLGLINTVILARLLTPEDFGIVAVALLTLWFVASFAESGTDAYILQEKSLTHSQLNSSWTLNIVLKVLAFFLLSLAAPIVAWHQNSSELTAVIISIGFVLPVEAIRNPGLLILRRNQDYGKIVSISVFAKLLALAFSIPLAFILRNHWPLIVGQLASTLTITVLSYKISSYRPSFDVSDIHCQWLFSKWIILKAVLGYFRNHVDSILVGGRYELSGLGAYNNMKYFSAIPTLQLLSPILAPLHAELGRVSDVKSEVRFQIDFTLKVASYVISWFSAFFYFGAEDIVYVVLGNEWTIYYKIFSYLGLIIIPFFFVNQASRILMVASNTKMIFIYELLSSTIIFLVLFSIGTVKIEIFALCKVISEIVLGSLYYFYAYSAFFGAQPISNFLKYFGIIGLNFLFLYFAIGYLPNGFGHFLNCIFLAVLISSGLVSYLLVDYSFFFSDREKHLIKKIASLSK
jgi:lipopolysaccharide exporter